MSALAVNHSPLRHGSIQLRNGLAGEEGEKISGLQENNFFLSFFTLILSPKSPRLLASMASVPTAYHNSWNIDSRVSIMISKDR